jgi:hypothetical protein
MREVRDFTNSRGILRDCCCKRCTESEDPNNQRLFENFPQGVHAKTLLEAFSSQEKYQKG